MNHEGFYTKKELEAKGWTKKMFKDHLPEPHKKIPNPFNAAWAPMGLYDKEIVEALEDDPVFQGYKEWTVGFRARMKEVARETKARRV